MNPNGNENTKQVPITAKDSDNVSLEDVEVKLSNSNNTYTATTGSNGEATIDDVLFGTYNVSIENLDTATYSDYAPKTKTVNKSSFRVDLVLTKT